MLLAPICQINTKTWMKCSLDLVRCSVLPSCRESRASVCLSSTWDHDACRSGTGPVDFACNSLCQPGGKDRPDRADHAGSRVRKSSYMGLDCLQVNTRILKDRAAWANGWKEMSELPTLKEADSGRPCKTCNASGYLPCPRCYTPPEPAPEPGVFHL